MKRAAVALAAVLAVAGALWHLSEGAADLVVTRDQVGGVPVTVFRPRAGQPAPAIAIAHGFAGSQQLMQPFAVTLARNGYVAVTVDFPGHGANAAPLPGGLADRDARSAALREALDAVVAYARGLPQSDGRLALIGHSMASDVVVRYAQSHPDVAATVAVSLFLAGGITPGSPRNLLVLTGALEPAALIDAGRAAVGAGDGRSVAAGVTVGSVADGTARRLALARGAEHIGVLYGRDSMTETLDWMNQTFGQRGAGAVDARGPWLALLYAGLVALAWPLANALPRVAPTPVGAGLGGRRFAFVAVAPAVLTPLLLWRAPTDWLPLLLGDYLALHFGLYGFLTAAGLWLVRRGEPHPAAPPARRAALAAATLLVCGYLLVGFGAPTDAYVAAFWPPPERLPFVAAMLAGTLPYFLADEWATRGASAPRYAYALTKVCFLASLAAAIALSLAKLFFLAIIVPAILAFFVAFGLASSWVYRHTLHPLPGAAANAAVFAWAIAATFPIVAR
jgi:dienelactone hydrolase